MTTPRAALPSLRAFLGSIACRATTSTSANLGIPSLEGGLTETDQAVQSVVNSLVPHVDAVAGVITSASSFGLLADGTTDETTRMQAAVDSFAQTGINRGGTLLLPAGTIRITSPIMLPSNVTVRGQGNAPNLSDNQGATLIDASACDYAFDTDGTDEAWNVVIEDLAIKSAAVAAIRLRKTYHSSIRRVSCFGSSMPIGVHVTSDSYFNSIIEPNINGLASGIGVLVDGASNETTIMLGCIRQNGTNVKVSGECNGVALAFVDMEGSAGQIGLHVIDSEVTAFRCRLEQIATGVKLEESVGQARFHGLMNHYSAATVAILDNTASSKHALYEPFIDTATTAFSGTGASKLAAVYQHDASNLQAVIGTVRLSAKSGGGGQKIHAPSGVLQLSTAGGNQVELTGVQGTVTVGWGSGSPEGVVTAPVGSTFHRTNGGAGTCFYVKESGSGNTGWVAK